MLTSLLLGILAAAPTAKPAAADIQIVINDTDVATAAGEQAAGLLKEKGYSIAPKTLTGEPSKKALKLVKRILKLEVLKPKTCYVMATLTAADSGKTLFMWQTQNDADACPAQVRSAIEAMATKAPPLK